MASTFDLHTHTAASDGTDTPGELLQRAKSAGLDTVAITDHDTLAGVREAIRDVPEGLRLIPGVELSCRGAAGKCHILGLGVDTEDPELNGVIRRVAVLRQEKLERRIGFLRERGMELPASELEYLRMMPSPGKPHLTSLLLKYGYVRTSVEAFELLKKCGTGEDRLEAKSAIGAILRAGGVPVWAHPRGGVDDAVTEAEFSALLPELVSCGLRGLECWYSMYPAKLCRELADIASKNGLLVSAGSDYHGGNKTVPLGRLRADAAPVPRKAATLLDRI